MKTILKTTLGLCFFLLLTSYNIVKHKKYNYYVLDKHSFIINKISFHHKDQHQDNSQLADGNVIFQKPKKLYVSVVSWGKALLDENLDIKPATWKNMDKVFPTDTITGINLQYYIKTRGTVYKIPYKFISSIDFEYSSFTIERKDYTITHDGDYPLPTFEDLAEYMTSYNDRDSIMSYKSMRNQTLLCELDLNNIDYKNLKKNKLVANFIIEFSNGRKLSIEKSISVY